MRGSTSRDKRVWFDPLFFRFLIVGVLNTAFGYGSFALLIYLGLHYSIAIAISTVAGILFNFKTIGHFVFESKDNSLIVRFFGVYFIAYIINVSGLWMLSKNGISPYLAGALLILPVGFMIFSLQRIFVFNQKT